MILLTSDQRTNLRFMHVAYNASGDAVSENVLAIASEQLGSALCRTLRIQGLTGANAPIIIHDALFIHALAMSAKDAMTLIAQLVDCGVLSYADDTKTRLALTAFGRDAVKDTAGVMDAYLDGLQATGRGEGE